MGINNFNMIRMAKKAIRDVSDKGIGYTLYRIKSKIRYSSIIKTLKKEIFSYEIAKKKEQVIQQEIQSHNIMFSIIMPVYNTPIEYLSVAVDSVRSQTYECFELCVVDASDDEYGYIYEYFEEICSTDERIIYKKLKKNLGISDNSNKGIDMATGDYVCFLDHDDMLHPYALMEANSIIINEKPQTIYTDELVFEHNPHNVLSVNLKPDYSLDMLRSCNYICHLFFINKELLDNIGGFNREYDGSQDHELILRACHNSKYVAHIDKVLYFWRYHSNSVSSDIGAKPYVVNAGKAAVMHNVLECGEKAQIESIADLPTTYHVSYEYDMDRLISIIIVSEHYKDNSSLLSSINKSFGNIKHEIIIPDNKDVTINRIKLMNNGAQKASGDYLLFVDETIGFTDDKWIDELAQYIQRSDVCAVGPKIISDKKIYSAGLYLTGTEIVVDDLYKNYSIFDTGYMERLLLSQDITALNSKCIMIDANDFCNVGGFDETLNGIWADMDICLRMSDSCKRVVFNPFSKVSIKDTKDITNKKEVQINIDIFNKKWNNKLELKDKYVNKIFS